MNRFLPIILTCAVICTARIKNVGDNDTMKVTTSNVVINDTIKASLSIKPIVIPVKSNEDTNIILVKEQNADTDWAKYALPILTLFLGIGVNRLIDTLNKKKNTLVNGKRWVVELDSTKEPIEQQIEELEIFKRELSFTEFQIPTLTAMTPINGDAFKSLDKNELIRYIEIKNKDLQYREHIKISNQTHGYISILQHQHNMITERFQSYLTGTSQHVQTFNKNLQIFIAENRSFVLSFEKAGADIEVAPETALLVDLYLKYIEPHLTDGKFNPFLLRDEYFAPIIKHCISYRNDDRANRLADAATACLNNIAGLRMEVVYINENVDTLIKRYTELKDSLPSLVDEINGNKN